MPRHRDPNSHSSSPSSEDQILLECAGAAIPFRSKLGQPCFSLQLTPFTRQVFAIRSGILRDWIVAQYFAQYESPPPARALRRVLQAFEAQARCSEKSEPILPRVASVKDDSGAPLTLLYLGNSQGDCVRIASDGWQITDGTTHAFSWHRGNLPLPTPSKDADPAASLAALRRLLNPLATPDWLRLLAFLVSCLRPDGPFPILVLEGPPGSGKSTAARLIRALIDPSTAPLMPLPARNRDLLSLAARSWLLAFDHVFSIRSAIAAGLCRLSTGAGRAFRDGPGEIEDYLVSLRRPVMLTASSGETLHLPPDLAARALTVRLPAVSPAARRTETAIQCEFEQHRPGILGALCSAAAVALRRSGELCLPRAPWFADAAVAAVAAAPTLGVSEDEILAALLHAPASPPPNPVALSLCRFMQRRPEWEGLPCELLAALKPSSEPPNWPRTAKGLSQALHSAAGFLHASGLSLDFGKSNGLRSIRVAHHAPETPAGCDPVGPNPSEDQ